MDFLKRSWAQLLILLGVAAGALAVFFTRKRELPPIPPPAPELPPVDIPDVNTAPATTYLDTKAQPVDVTKNGVSAVITRINERHDK
jgi:hypothetical protein